MVILKFDCAHCGKPTEREYRGSGTRPTLCSKACKMAAWKARHPDRPKPRPPHSYPKPPAICGCGERIAHRRLRCAECDMALDRKVALEYAKRRHAPAARNCKECGASFVPAYGTKLKTFCSTDCGYRNAKRIARLKGKAIKRAATVETVDPIKVFNRDGWRCHLCSRKTPRKLRGTLNEAAPELDHIVPLAKGGEHSYANTACACRRCNAEKSDTIKGQPSLLAA